MVPTFPTSTHRSAVGVADAVVFPPILARRGAAAHARRRSAPARRLAALAFVVASLVSAPSLLAQQGTGRLSGKVTLEATGEPLHGATVIVLGPGKSVVTGEDGTFEIKGLPAGTYDVVATREHLTAAQQSVTVAPEQTATVTFTLALSAVHEEVTVTASLGTATAYEAFNAVKVVDSFELSKDMGSTIGDVLENQPGVAKRSFGAGNSRPIIRGFDGDRVLILENGMRSGDLSSQSGDHGVSIDPAGLDRLEVVRGPATLLYGSNAIGGVVNAITPHEVFETSPTKGVHGQFVTDLGSANGQAGANGSIHVGRETWNYWAGGGSRRTGNYDTPLGPVEDSFSHLRNGKAGFGYNNGRTFFSFGVQAENGSYGIPFAGFFEGEADSHIQLDTERQVVRADVGARNLGGPLDNFKLILNYTRWRHNEIETVDGERNLGTAFKNDVVGVRGEFTQRTVGRVSGKFGFSTEHRTFDALGAEALAPRTTHANVAAYAFEEANFGRARPSRRPPRAERVSTRRSRRRVRPAWRADGARGGRSQLHGRVGLRRAPRRSRRAGGDGRQRLSLVSGAGARRALQLRSAHGQSRLRDRQLLLEERGVDGARRQPAVARRARSR